jgi:hypothetical protein
MQDFIRPKQAGSEQSRFDIGQQSTKINNQGLAMFGGWPFDLEAPVHSGHFSASTMHHVGRSPTN